MAEPDTAKINAVDRQTDSAGGVAGDAALKAIAHLQQVAETLASDAAKLAESKPESPAQNADPRPEERLEGASRRAAGSCDSERGSGTSLTAPARHEGSQETKAKKIAAERAAEASKATAVAPRGENWRARLHGRFEHVAWSQAAAAAALTLAVAGGAYLGLMDYLDRKETQRIAAEEALRHPSETLAEREMRGKIAELQLELQGMRGQMNKIAADARLAQTQSAAGAAASQAVARVEKLEKELAAKLDGQLARVERLERIAADPIVTSSIGRDQKGQPTSAAGAPAPVRQGLRTPDPSMKPNTFVLRSVRNGLAMVQTSRGMLEVGPGDVIPGVGRVRAIRRMDGRWVLVMHDGYIDQEDE